MEYLKVTNLSKDFGGLRAVDHVTFEVQKGERLVIIGPNGAGKTTLFNLISGEEPPTEGGIHAVGKEVTGMPPQKRASLGLARTFQITQLFSNLRVMDNILLGLQALDPVKFSMFRPATSNKSISTRAQDFLEQWDLWDQRQSLVKNLSHGDQRKIEIILAICNGPKLLLLDEPTAGLSPAETESLTSLILNLSGDITVLLIEHDMDVAFQVAERIIVLHFGRVLADGKPDEIRNNSQVNEVYLGGNLSCLK